MPRIGVVAKRSFRWNTLWSFAVQVLAVFEVKGILSDSQTSSLREWICQVMVLSGHDHDQCFILHESKQGYVPEVMQTLNSPILFTNCTYS
jgi:hypothetical protein